MSAPLKASVWTCAFEKRMTGIPKAALEQILQRLCKMRLVLHIDILDAFETFESRTTLRKKRLRRKEIVLTLV